MTFNSRYILSIVALWLLSIAITAASSVVRGDPLLWRVTGVDQANSVYLFGSIHFGHDGMYPLSESVMSSFEGADKLVVEVDLLASNPEEMSELLSMQGYNPEGVTLSSLLSEEDWLRFTDICRRQGAVAERFEHMQPWLAAVQLAAIQMRASGFTDGYGVDRYFLNMAKAPEQKKQIVELESLESQLGIFAGLDLQQQVMFLRQSMAEFDVGNDYLQRIALAWQAGDEAALQQLIIGAFDDTEVAQTMYRVIFTERNQRMATAVSELLSTRQQAFVVVGVGHMIGEDGLVAQLRARGLQVEAL